MHVKKPAAKRNAYGTSSGQANYGVSNSGDSSSGGTFSQLAAKAKTLISASFDVQLSGNEYLAPSNGSLSPGVAATSQDYKPSTGESDTIESSSQVATKFMKQYFNSNQNSGHSTVHTSDFKKYRDNTIGRYVIQSNKLLITLDKLISFDFDALNDDYKRECKFWRVIFLFLFS